MRIGSEVTPPQLRGAGNGLGIVVQRVNGRTETAGREAEEAAPRSHVYKALPPKVFGPEQALERGLRYGDAVVIELREKPSPVLPELKSLARRDFLLMLAVKRRIDRLRHSRRNVTDCLAPKSCGRARLTQPTRETHDRRRSRFVNNVARIRRPRKPLSEPN